MADDNPPQNETGVSSNGVLETFLSGYYKFLSLALVTLFVVYLVHFIFGAVYISGVGHIFALGLIGLLISIPLGFITCWKHSKYFSILHALFSLLLGIWNFVEFCLGCYWASHGWGPAVAVIIFGLIGTGACVATVVFVFMIYKLNDYNVEWFE